MEKRLRVLSLFDGISCARVALRAAVPDIPIDYFVSEVCPYASAVRTAHWPDAVNLGDVTCLDMAPGSWADLLVGGSPCTDLTCSGKRAGLGGSESKLFWEYVRIKTALANRLRYFLFENVATMDNAARDEITKALGVEPVLLDAAAFGPVVRRRYFWTNIPLTAPPTWNATPLSTILDPPEVHSSDTRLLPDTGYTPFDPPHIGRFGAIRLGTQGGDRRRDIFSDTGKLPAMTGSCRGTWVRHSAANVVRTLSCEEIERAQGLPTGYTDVEDPKRTGKLSRSRRAELVALGFHVAVVTWILTHAKFE